jgi:hypothetical protein
LLLFVCLCTSIVHCIDLLVSIIGIIDITGADIVYYVIVPIVVIIITVCIVLCLCITIVIMCIILLTIIVTHYITLLHAFAFD